MEAGWVAGGRHGDFGCKIKRRQRDTDADNTDELT